jgi:hypothetical protein
MGCINSKTENSEIELESVITHNREFNNISELIKIQHKLDFNQRTSYWSNIDPPPMLDLNDKNTVNVIKALGI